MAKVQESNHASWLPGALPSAIPLSKQKSVKDNNKKDWLPTTLVVENKIILDEENLKRGSSSSGGSMMKCLDNRKIVCIIIIYALIATGLWSLFLPNPFGFGREKQLEALKDQVDLLDEEVDQLETQVDRLGSEVTRLSNETDRLEDINDELKLTTADLNKTVNALADLNDSLNISLSTREDLSELLDDSISSAQEINNHLVESLTELGDRIESITDLNEELKSTQQDLEEEQEKYIAITEAFESSNILLASEVNNLEAQVAEMQSQNEILSKHNADLQSILEFLNQAGLDLNATTQAISDYLVEEITENSALILRDLELSYQNVYLYWICTSTFEFEDDFISKAWMINRNAAIGEDDYDTVMDFVDDHVFGDICASIADFENFLVSDQYIDYQGSIPPVDISLNTLTSGIERYSTMMIEYYFPPDANGLSASDWTNYRYDCSNIPSEQRYVWSQDR